MTRFGALPCPGCCAEATCSLNLEDLDTITCGDCNEEFTIEEITKIIGKWGPVVAWINRKEMV